MVNEVKIMKLQHHKAVLPLYAAFLVDDQLWMVLPFVAGGSAQDILKRFKDGTVRAQRPVIGVEESESVGTFRLQEGAVRGTSTVHAEQSVLAAPLCQRVSLHIK